jgi:modulator of FtsH protease
MDRRTLYSGAAERPAVEINKVLRNTYMLLSMTLLFSAVTATIAMFAGVGFIGSMAMLIGGIICMFVVNKKANSAAGIYWVFAFTGLMGGSLGFMLNMYVSNGAGALVGQALGGTALVFIALSAYVVTTKKNFNFIGGFLIVGMVVAVLAMIANIFFQMPGLHMAINAVVIFLMSGFILYDTSRIVRGEEDNYVLATVGLYLNIYNMFIHMLSLLGMSED